MKEDIQWGSNLGETTANKSYGNLVKKLLEKTDSTQ